MSAQNEFEKALKYLGIDAEHFRKVAGSAEHYSLRIPDTYVFKEPEKDSTPRPGLPEIDRDKVRRIGSEPAMASGNAKGPDGAFNPGMSLRMWLAGQAMNGMMASGNLGDRFAHIAFTFADDMITESMR